ncbi:hypothetical protein PG984_011286 [Apiospora sp. TS-2023a]
MWSIIPVSLVSTAFFGLAVAAPSAAAASALQPILEPRCMPKCQWDCTMTDCGGRHFACGNGCCEAICIPEHPCEARCDNARWLGY